jgi:hypothetical protein
MRSKKLKRILLIFIGIAIALGVSFFVYVNDFYASDKSFDEYRAIYDTVQIVDKGKYISIKESESNTKGIVFYQGAKVEYTAYIPLLVTLSQNGYECFLVKMPFHLAVFNIGAADKVISENSHITDWYIGGHSLGGVMASSYARNNSYKLKGIFLFGAYPSSDLSDTNLKMISIYGENDLILNRDKLNETMENAPSDSFYYEMSGANHGGFGDYGMQKGDGEAKISSSEQIEETVTIIIEELSN